MTHRIPQAITAALCAALLALGATSCSDDTSYADLLTNENHYVNAFLVDQRVEGEVPPDSVFEVGPNAPYYRMESEGNIYMQVLDPGTGQRPAKGDRVYFRFTRYALSTYVSGGEPMTGEGNTDDVSGDNGLGARYFIYDDYTLQTSYLWGTGLQVPMHYLGDQAQVNLIVKSQFGFINEVGNVVPYLYTIRYYSSPLAPWTSTDTTAQ